MFFYEHPLGYFASRSFFNYTVIGLAEIPFVTSSVLFLLSKLLYHIENLQKGKRIIAVNTWAVDASLSVLVYVQWIGQ